MTTPQSSPKLPTKKFLEAERENRDAKKECEAAADELIEAAAERLTRSGKVKRLRRGVG